MVLQKRSSEYFNSQPHKEADSSAETYENIKVISTHSLTRRLTSSSVNFNEVRIISTHSLTRRLTMQALGSGYYVVEFQLTASQGG